MNQDNIKTINIKLNTLKQAANELNLSIESIKNDDFAVGNYLRNIKTLSLQMKDLCISCDRQVMFLSNEFRGLLLKRRSMADKRKRDLEELRRREKRERKNKERI